MIFQPNLIVHVVEPTKEQAKYGPPLPYTTHFIGRNKCPLTTSGNSTVFLAHYLQYNQPFSGPVRKLTFNQLGSCETPDLRAYANTCEVIEFNGYINTPRTVFEVIHQLPKAMKVDFFIGAAQHHLYMNDYSNYKTKAPLCSRVKTLKIVMDFEYFHSFQHTCNGDMSLCGKLGNCLNGVQHSLIFFVESLLKNAAESFPNLKNLIVDLPENDRLCKAVQSLIKVSHGLRRKTQTTFQSAGANGKATEMYTAENIESTYTPHSWISSESVTGCSPTMVPIDYSNINPAMPLHPIVNCAHSFDTYQTGQMLMSPSSSEMSQMSPVISHRPPPGFLPLEVQVPGNFQGYSGFQNYEVEQRVNNWLRNVEEN